MNTITPLSAFLGRGSATTPPSGPGPDHQSQHSAEQMLTARVVEVKSKNRFVLDFNGNQIVATSKASLSAGQTITLQVASTTPQVELTIVANGFTALAGKPLILLGSTIDLTTLLDLLHNTKATPTTPLSATSAATLTTFLPPDIQTLLGSNDGGAFIKKLFSRLGLNLEALHAQKDQNQARQTLKAALLEVLVKFNQVEQISAQANRLLATIDLYQQVQVQLNQHNALIFPLPLPFFEQGYLLVEQYQQESAQDENKKGRHAPHYTLHLAMTGLGTIKIAFLLGEHGLSLTFFLDSEQKTTFVAKRTDTLLESIREIKDISVRYSAELESPTTELLKKITPQGTLFVNTTA